ncbi:hypothetical protein BZM27_39790 [Paraburkholderia steynii]|uniref:Uncharacterized protein n=1 Tax=Paraburkholderia steynii TaxID=1245441 RepID=A0A4R0XCR1_9BURK|nr:hypothetical protein BZM27_39790 [Paraburkholderia steynii]
MPALTYLMVENPLGAIGMKVPGLAMPTKAGVDNLLKPIERVTGNETNLTSLAPFGAKGGRYVNRATNIDANIPARTFAADTVENRQTITKLFAKAGRSPSLRVAMPSSLRSGLRYLTNHCTNTDYYCDTVILYGHGSPGEINLGLGKISVGPRLETDDKGYKQRKNVREAFGLDNPDGTTKRIRALSAHNIEEWIAEFQSNLFLGPGGSPHEFFTLFLIGCNVGAGITKDMAKTLSKALGFKTFIAAPSVEVFEGHLIYLLDNLVTTKTALAAGKIVYLYTADLQDQVELKYEMGKGA